MLASLLELGGKNALVAYGDADVERVAEAAVRGMKCVARLACELTRRGFIWAGQSCGSVSRLFLHDSIHDQVVAALLPRISASHQPGDPSDMATTMGPLVSRAQRDKVLSFVESGKSEGAKLVLGGKQPSGPALKRGYFVEPTVFTGPPLSLDDGLTASHRGHLADAIVPRGGLRPRAVGHPLVGRAADVERRQCARGACSSNLPC